MADGFTLGPNAIQQIRELMRQFYAEVDPSWQLGNVQSGEARKPIVIGKTDAAHVKGETGTISVYKGSSSGGYDLTDTGENITAYNRFGSIASGKFVAVRRMIHGWEIIAAEC
jgi:hypothetical protein